MYTADDIQEAELAVQEAAAKPRKSGQPRPTGLGLYVLLLSKRCNLCASQRGSGCVMKKWHPAWLAQPQEPWQGASETKSCFFACFSRPRRAIASM
jgi:hypothetical protein